MRPFSDAAACSTVCLNEITRKDTVMSMMDATLTGPTKTPETKRIAGASPPVRPRSRRRRLARRDHAHLLRSIERRGRRRGGTLSLIPGKKHQACLTVSFSNPWNSSEIAVCVMASKKGALFLVCVSIGERVSCVAGCLSPSDVRGSREHECNYAAFPSTRCKTHEDKIDARSTQQIGVWG